MYIYNNLRMEIGCFQYGNKVSDFVGKSIWRSDVFGKRQLGVVYSNPLQKGEKHLIKEMRINENNIQKINFSHVNSAYGAVMLGVLPRYDS